MFGGKKNVSGSADGEDRYTVDNDYWDFDDDPDTESNIATEDEENETSSSIIINGVDFSNHDDISDEQIDFLTKGVSELEWLRKNCTRTEMISILQNWKFD